MTEISTYKQLTGEMDGFENFLVDNGIPYSRRMLTPEETRIPEALLASMDNEHMDEYRLGEVITIYDHASRKAGSIRFGTGLGNGGAMSFEGDGFFAAGDGKPGIYDEDEVLEKLEAFHQKDWEDEKSASVFVALETEYDPDLCRFNHDEMIERFIESRGGYSLDHDEDHPLSLVNRADPALIQAMRILDDKALDYIVSYDSARNVFMGISDDAHSPEVLNLSCFVTQDDLSGCDEKTLGFLKARGYEIRDEKEPDRQYLVQHSKRHIEKEMEEVKAALRGVEGVTLEKDITDNEVPDHVVFTTKSGTEYDFNTKTQTFDVEEANGWFEDCISLNGGECYVKDPDFENVMLALKEAVSKTEEYFKDVNLLDYDAFDERDMALIKVRDSLAHATDINVGRIMFEDGSLCFSMTTEKGTELLYAAGGGLYISLNDDFCPINDVPLETLRALKDPDVFMAINEVDNIKDIPDRPADKETRREQDYLKHLTTEASVDELEYFLGYEISGEVLEEIDGRVEDVYRETSKEEMRDIMDYWGFELEQEEEL